MTDIIIPIKALSSAKSRLSGALSASDRCNLVMAMLEDLLAVVSTFDRGRIWIVASDDAVFDLGARFGAHEIREPEIRGYNAAVVLGFNAVPEGRGIAVLPGDVPLATYGEIAALLAPTDPRPTIRLAAAHDRLGTNGLFLSDKDLLSPMFGTNSLAGYVGVARALDVETTVLHAPYLAQDIDTPADLRALSMLEPGGATGKFLNSLQMAADCRVCAMGAA